MKNRLSFIFILTFFFKLAFAQTEYEGFIDITKWEGIKAVPNDDVSDWEAINGALKTGQSIYFPSGTYLVDKRLGFGYENVRYLGDPRGGSIIKYSKPYDDNPWDNYLAIISGNNVTFENIIFDGSFLDVYVALIEYSSGSNVTFRNCVFRNIKGSPNGSDNIYAIRIEMAKATNFIFDQVTFENISSIDKDNSVGSNGGFAGGIFLMSQTPAHQLPTSNSKIINCTFKNIFTENATKQGWDADGIRLYTKGTIYDSLQTDLNLRIDSNYFEGVQKSAIKLSTVKGVSMMNNTVKSTREDIRQMLCAIRIQWGKNISVKNTFVAGDFDLIYNLKGSDIDIENTQPISGDSYVCRSSIVQVQKHQGVINDRISITGIEGGQIRRVLRTSTVTRDTVDLTYHTTSISIRNINLRQQMEFLSLNGAKQGILDLRKIENAFIENIVITKFGESLPLYVEDCKEISLNDFKSSLKKKANYQLSNSTGTSTPNNLVMSNFTRIRKNN